MRRVRPSLGVGLLAVAVLAASCGTGDSTEAGSPLAEFLGQDLYGLDLADPEAQARYAEQEREREAAVAACMKDQGFEYIPRDNSDLAATTTADGLDYNSREYAEKYGFGFTTERFSQQEVGPDLVGHNYDELDESFDDDPNAEIVASMDDATQQAYYDALYGPEDSFPTLDPTTMTDEELQTAREDFAYEPQGCEGQVWADDFNNAFYQEFDAELQALDEAINTDQRMKDHNQAVSDCVADKGFRFDGSNSYETLYSEFEPDLNAIEEMIGGYPDVELSEEELATMSEAELDEVFSQPREFTAEARARLAELQARETEIAVAVFDCGGSFAESQKLYREISADYEARFLEDNADRLGPYAAGTR